MSRLIKFRYIFRHIDNVRFETKYYSLGQLEESGTSKLSPCFAATYGYELINRSQYTNLTDKHGFEIYEGDFIKNDRGIILKVVWYDGSFFAEGLSHKGHDICNLLLIYTSWSEVIGNIHTNPKLLESK